MEFSQKGKIILAGDLNARTSTDPDFTQYDSELPDDLENDYIIDSILPARHSLDGKKSTCARGKALLELCISSRMRILNGRTFGDLNGNLTCYETNGSSLVDYVITSEELLPCIPYFCVHDLSATLSDHCALSFKINIKKQLPDIKAEKNIPMPRRFKWNPIVAEKFKAILQSSEFQNRLNDFMNSKFKNTFDGINDASDSFTKIIYEAADKTVITPRSTISRKNVKNESNKSWLKNPEIWRLKRNVKDKAKLLNSHPFDKKLEVITILL